MDRPLACQRARVSRQKRSLRGSRGLPGMIGNTSGTGETENHVPSVFTYARMGSAGRLQARRDYPAATAARQEPRMSRFPFAGPVCIATFIVPHPPTVIFLQ